MIDSIRAWTGKCWSWTLALWAGLVCHSFATNGVLVSGFCCKHLGCPGRVCFHHFRGQAALNIELPLARLILRSNIFSGTQARWPRVFWIPHLAKPCAFQLMKSSSCQKEHPVLYRRGVCSSLSTCVFPPTVHSWQAPLCQLLFILLRSLQLWVWWQPWLLIERWRTQWAAAVEIQGWLCWDILGFPKIGKKVAEWRRGRSGTNQTYKDCCYWMLLVLWRPQGSSCSQWSLGAFWRFEVCISQWGCILGTRKIGLLQKAGNIWEMYGNVILSLEIGGWNWKLLQSSCSQFLCLFCCVEHAPFTSCPY